MACKEPIVSVGREQNEKGGRAEPAAFGVVGCLWS